MNLSKKDENLNKSKFDFKRNIRSPINLNKINSKKENDFNSPSISINYGSENNKNQLSLLVKEPSKINILHKIFDIN